MSAAATLLKGAKPQSSQPAVLFENCGKLINAILNKPSTLNAIDLDITRALSSEIAKWNQSPQVKVLFLNNFFHISIRLLLFRELEEKLFVLVEKSKVYITVETNL